MSAEIKLSADHYEANASRMFPSRSTLHIELPSGAYWMAPPPAMPPAEARALIDTLAATHDMLAALRIVLEQAAAMEKDAEMYRGWFGKVAAIAETAIAKAEGRA